MKVCIINGSPKGNNSITLQSCLYLQKHFKKCVWTQINAGQKIRYYETHMEEALSLLEEADLLLFSYPVYTFMAPWQLHRFIELLKETGVDLEGKFAAQITTSKHFYDITAHAYIRDNCQDLGLIYLDGFSADMEDLTKPEGQKAVLEFWKLIGYTISKKLYELPARCPVPSPLSSYTASLSSVPKDKKHRVAIVTNAENDDTSLSAMIEDFQRILPYESEVINIAEFPFKGGCISCFHCATEGICIYKDGFPEFLREHIQSADAIVLAFTIKDHSMGASFKLYDDRQFCNGHRTVTMGRPFAYLIRGDYAHEQNLQTVIEGRAQVGGNYLAGVALDQESMIRMCKRLVYACEHHYVPSQNFYGIGGMKIFRDLIYVMGGMMKADHKFYKEHGFFRDMPHRQVKQILLMNLVGAMLSNPKIMSKMGNKMNEGMLMPYKKVLDD